MSNEQIISVSFFEFQGFKNRWWGFSQMGLALDILKDVPGLQFCKILGSGAGNGFSIRPNFGVYGLLSVWDNRQSADLFFSEHSYFQEFQERTNSLWTVFLKTAKSHGQWEGQNPFAETTKYDKNQAVAVLTRATIHTHQLAQFWKFVPPVSRSMSQEKKGLLFSVGIGELPLIQQATFSLWQNSHLMMDFAYKSGMHKKVVKRTREKGWYKEELFARFHPIDSFGSWKGENPLG